MLSTIKKIFGTTKNEKRQQYRVEASKGPSILVCIVHADQSEENVELINSSAGGLKFNRAKNAALKIAEGDELFLRIRAATDLRNTETVVFVRRVESEDDGMAYGCQFQDPAHFFDTATPKLWKLFNRRRAFRAEPPVTDIPSVTLSVGDSKIVGELRDVSAGGLAIRYDEESDVEFEIETQVSVEFGFLPELGKTTTLKAEVRHKSSNGKMFIVGVQFDGDLEEKVTDAILDYVAEQQTRVMRQKSALD